MPGTVDGLATACAAFVRDVAGRPDTRELRRVLTRYVLPPPVRELPVPDDDQETSLLARPQLSVAVRHDGNTGGADRSGCPGVEELDGKPASAKSYRRKRSAVFNMLSFAVEKELLPDHPFTKIKHRVTKTLEQVDPGVVVNPRQASELLIALTYVGERDLDRGARLVAFFAVLYYAAARPAEGLALRESDCRAAGVGLG